MKITITKKMECHKTPAQCSDIIVNKLQEKFNCKLRAEKKTDTVHGYVTIDHTPNNHIIDIYFYDTDEPANFIHQTTMKKFGSIPTQNEIKKII